MLDYFVVVPNLHTLAAAGYTTRVQDHPSIVNYEHDNNDVRMRTLTDSVGSSRMERRSMHGEDWQDGA